MLAIVDPGDEVIVFEPFYENYGPDAILSGATPRFVRLREPDWSFDPAELAAAFNDKTRAIIINTPNNPTGKVFTRAELTEIAGLCQKWNVDRRHRRDLRAHPLRRGRARADGHARRHGRSDHRHQQRLEDVQRDRLARGLDDRAGRSHRRDPQGARLSDGWRGGAAAGRGGRGAAHACVCTTRIWPRRIAPSGIG